MPWRESLQQLKGELSGVRVARLERLEAFEKQVSAERDELLARQDSLDISTLLKDMNDILLDAQGEVETTVEWETGEDEEPLGLDDDAADVIITALSWNEGEELEIVVELVMLDEGISLMVNGVQIRQDRDALERALLSAFRDQLEI